MLRKLLLFSGILCLAGGLRAGDFTIAPTVREIAVVIPEKASPTVRMAARELAEHIGLAVGITPKIYNSTAAVPEDAFQFRLGATGDYGSDSTPLKFNGAQWRCDEKSYTIAGNNTAESCGTLFAVYDWLDRTLGCRWLWPGELGRVVPHSDKITFSTGKGLYAPKVECAFWRPLAWPDPKLWNTEAARVYFFSEQNRWLQRNRLFNNMALQNYPHAFEKWYQKYHASHPEWFSLLPDGRREPDAMHYGSPRLISMCVSNHELVKEVVQQWLKNPQSNLQINLNENDTPGCCTCDKCLEWDDSPLPASVRRAEATKRFKAGDRNWYQALGSVSNRYARFYMEVLKEVDRVAPERHAQIAGLVYSNYSKAPEIKMSDRIYQRYCPPVMFPLTKEKMDDYCSEYAKWVKTGCRMILRPNFTLCGHCFPINYAAEYARCYKSANDHGLVGFDIDSLTGNYSAMGTTLYTIARIPCRPDMNAKTIAEEYCAAFGAAAPLVERYFARLADITRNVCPKFTGQSFGPEGGDYSKYFIIAPHVFTPEVFAELYDILDQAAQGVKNDKLSAERVNWLRLGLKHAELTAATQLGFEQYKKNGDIGPFALKAAELEAFRAEHEKDFISNFGFLRMYENSVWPWEWLKFQGEKLQALPIQWKFRTDPENQGINEKWFASNYDDSKWNTIRTDKVWDSQLGEHYYGFAWYRLDIDLPQKMKGSPVLLVGAVDEACAVWINGKKCLSRPYLEKEDPDSWMKPFEVPFGKVATPGRNTIAVRVENRSGAGGLWKPCYLKYANAAINSAGNMIPNGNFVETKYWRPQNMFGNIAMSQRPGSCIITVKGIDKTKRYDNKFGAWGRFYQSFSGVKPGRRYILQAKFKTAENTDGAVRVWCYTRPFDNPGTEGNIMLSAGPTGNKSVTVQGEFTAFSEKATVYLNITANRGSVEFQSATLVPIDQQ